MEDKKTKFLVSLKDKMASPLGIIIACLLSFRCVLSVINLIGAFKNGAIAIIISGVITLFAVLLAVGIWKVFIGAKKNRTNFGEGFGMVGAYTKFNQVIVTIVTVFVCIVAALVLALAFFLKSKISQYEAQIINALEQTQTNPTTAGIVPAEVVDLVKKFFDLIVNKIAILVIIVALIVVGSIFMCIMYGKMSGAFKRVKLNSSIPSGNIFTAVLCCIYSIVYIVAFVKKFVGIIDVVTAVITFVGFALLFITFNMSVPEGATKETFDDIAEKKEEAIEQKAE
ncbi:MAG: hypothetical protein IJR66_02905 [Clostridia bacterium]|nr:hypothetical protein [Clostridia bacterium]